MNIFNLPDLGEGLVDAQVREWYVKEGDHVEIDQPIVSVETAKAVIDIPAPQSGYIIKRHATSNDFVQTGEPLASFEDCLPDSTTFTSTKAAVAPHLPVGTKEETPPPALKPKSRITPVMPAVRALARQHQVDLKAINPSSPKGMLTLEDVRKAAAAASNGLSSENIPLQGSRRAMALNLAQSQASGVTAAVLYEDADIQAWDPSEDYTVRSIRAVIKACQTEPALNAHYFHHNLSQKRWNTVNLGIAIDSATGLYVPVLKDVANVQDSDLRKKIDQFKQEADNQSFSLHAFTDASIILSNFGSLGPGGGHYAVPVIVPPIVAVVAIGRARKKVVAFEDKVAIHKTIPLTLAFDHRAVTGGEAARFLMAMVKDLQNCSR